MNSFQEAKVKPPGLCTVFCQFQSVVANKTELIIIRAGS